MRSVGWRPAAWQMVPRRTLHFLLHWLIKLVALAVILLWRRKPLAALVAALVLGLWWFAYGSTFSFVLSPPPISGALASPPEQFSTVISSMPPPALAAEQYLRAQSQFDARAMWDVVSEEMKRAATARGGGLTLQRLEQQLEEAKKNGLRYEQVTYNGGYLAPDGRGFYLYVVVVSSGGNKEYVSYTFTIDQQGKILRID